LPQINTRTFAGVVFAVLGLGACSGASTSEPTTTAFRIDFGPEKLLRAEFVSSFTRGFRAVGLTITNDQANCMANGLLNEFGMDELDQLMRDSEAGKPGDPAVLDRGAKAIVGCLPADTVAALANRND